MSDRDPIKEKERESDDIRFQVDIWYRVGVAADELAAS